MASMDHIQSSKGPYAHAGAPSSPQDDEYEMDEPKKMAPTAKDAQEMERMGKTQVLNVRSTSLVNRAANCSHME